ncbi:MAG TPA: ATP-binding protein, partial [Solirubrobacterales bacterium]|nr:ATP-binding protein [Solirubrobacterales bacterium]
MQGTRPGDLRANLPLPPIEAHRLEFGFDDLHEVRAQVAAAATAAGLEPARVADLAAAASELAANSVLHGGGRGLATIWGDGGAVFVEVADAGRITDPEAGTRLPDPEVEHGRGLYIANQLCDEVSIESGESGTRVRLRAGGT